MELQLGLWLGFGRDHVVQVVDKIPCGFALAFFAFSFLIHPLFKLDYDYLFIIQRFV